MEAPASFAIHQGTTERQWGFADSVEGYARHGIRALTVRRALVEDYGSAKAARLISDAGLQVLGVSRCASLTENDPIRIDIPFEDNTLPATCQHPADGFFPDDHACRLAGPIV